MCSIHVDRAFDCSPETSAPRTSAVALRVHATQHQTIAPDNENAA
jgi:hypothetical protein